MTVAELNAAIAGAWREDVDAEPFAYEQQWVEWSSAAFKPGWCILHGLPEPCWKCNACHVGEEVSAR